jgi:glycosyltransferase involved in cell wall biosynthesis
MNKISVLILCPHPSGRGGVADYYRILRDHFHSDKIELHFYYTGKDFSDHLYQNRVFKSASDLLALLKELRGKDLVVLNPSLDPKAVIRDGVFHFIAKSLFRKKTLVFFHGWIPDFEEIIERYFNALFKLFFDFNRALVLASQFRNALIRWGYVPGRISLETTLYEHHEYDVYKNRFNIIFLSRFSKEKGCLEAIQTIEMLVDEFPEVKLFMAGDGEMMPVLEQYVTNRSLEKHVKFTGWLKGDEKYLLLHQCGIMLFPTSYGEGMPISIIEGMGAGLAIVTRPVAGIPAILTDLINGYLLESLRPCDYAIKLRYLFQNEDVWQNISNRNKLKAVERFEAGNVAKRIERLYWDIVQ